MLWGDLYLYIIYSCAHTADSKQQTTLPDKTQHSLTVLTLNCEPLKLISPKYLLYLWQQRVEDSATQIQHLPPKVMNITFTCTADNEWTRQTNRNNIIIYYEQKTMDRSDWQIQCSTYMYIVDSWCWTALTDRSSVLLTCILLTANVRSLWLTDQTLLMCVLLTACVQTLTDRSSVLLTCILLTANVGPLWLTDQTLLTCILLTASVQTLWQTDPVFYLHVYC